MKLRSAFFFTPLVFLCMLGLRLAAQSATPPAAAPTAPEAAAAPRGQRGQRPPVVLNPSLPTIFIASDSTAAPGAGWGGPFAGYFDPAKVNIFNGAVSGRSSRTFIWDGATQRSPWNEVISRVKAGDYVLIQFGHNDDGGINDVDPPGILFPMRARGTLLGIGEETETIDNVVTKEKGQVVHTYGWYLRKMIAETQAKGATPILLSVTGRNFWADGKVERGLHDNRYGIWTKQVAAAGKLAFIDLTMMDVEEFQRRGEAETAKLFPATDKVHSSPAGADFNATNVVAGLKALKSAQFALYLSEKGAAIPPAPADKVVDLAKAK